MMPLFYILIIDRLCGLSFIFVANEAKLRYKYDFRTYFNGYAWPNTKATMKIPVNICMGIDIAHH